MNLKERGLTVGDLLILLVILFIAIFIFPKGLFENNKKDTSHIYSIELQELLVDV